MAKPRIQSGTSNQGRVISTFDMDEMLFKMHIHTRHPEFEGGEATLLQHSESHCLIPRVLNHFHDPPREVDYGTRRGYNS